MFSSKRSNSIWLYGKLALFKNVLIKPGRIEEEAFLELIHVDFGEPLYRDCGFCPRAFRFGPIST